MLDFSHIATVGLEKNRKKNIFLVVIFTPKRDNEHIDMCSIDNRNNISKRIENVIKFYGAAAGVFTTPCLLNNKNLELQKVSRLCHKMIFQTKRKQ